MLYTEKSVLHYYVWFSQIWKYEKIMLFALYDFLLNWVNLCVISNCGLKTGWIRYSYFMKPIYSIGYQLVIYLCCQYHLTIPLTNS